MDHQLRLITFLLALLFPAAAHAGINVEQRRADTEHKGVFGDVVLSGQLAYGNTNVLSISGGGLFGYRAKRHVVFALASGGFGSDMSGNQFVNNQMGHLRYNYRIAPVVWWEWFGQVERNNFILLKLRGLGGTGPRFHILDGKVNKATINLFYGTSYMPEYESLDADVLVDPGPDQADTFVHRWNNYTSLIVNPSDTVQLTTTLYYQPNMGRMLDYRIMNDYSLSVELANDLELDLSFQLRYDSMPATFCSEPLAGFDACPGEITPLKRLDLGTNVAFSYEF